MSQAPNHEVGSEQTAVDASSDRVTAMARSDPAPIKLSRDDYPPKRPPPTHDIRPQIHVDNKPRPSAFRRGLGLILVLAAVIAATSSTASWHKIFSALPWIGDVLGQPYSRWIAGSLLLLLGGLCLKHNVLHFLLTATLVGGSVYCVNLLLGVDLTRQWIALIAVGLGYLIHLDRKIQRPSFSGILGWVLIAGSGVGLAYGWFDWTALGRWIGGRTEQFFHTWGPECTWGTILILTALGATFSRTRPIHFFNAVLLGLLAYVCIHQGYIKAISFPELATGDVIPTIQQVSHKNVEAWRWILAGEMLLLGAIMLHQALGMGALTLAFAIAWMVVGTNIDKSVGRLTFTRFLSQALSGGSEHLNLSPSTLGNPRYARTATPQDSPLPSPSRPNGSKSFMGTAGIGVITLVLWLYVNAILAGLIGISGLRMLLEDSKLRMWAGYALWFTVGMGVMWLWRVWPTDPEQTWGKWLATWGLSLGLSRYHTQAIYLVALGVMAFIGSWALRKESPAETWLYTAATGIIIGTFLTLIAIGIMIKFGGFSVLPAWFYVVIAVGQSSMAWVLLMHHNLHAHGVVDGERIA